MFEEAKSYLRENVGVDDAETQKILFDSYLETVEEHRGKLKNAMEDLNFSEIALSAHSLKGCSANIGMEAMRVACYALELAGKAADCARCQDAYPEVDRLCGEVIAEGKTL
ncbi:MAG: Hpt domain-containing protein [Victivallaceae bacterium]|nr:Hpt domain-containing protein [Victivallaceae bacterium]